MPVVFAKDSEPFEVTLKRFKKRCEKAAILSDIKKHQAYEKPSEARKRKKNTSQRKQIKLHRRSDKH
ncbi:MAG: 30S ribosomal protein S21 [Candidatus Cloacimonetes bacterium]|nr:30S ribosomal protein S21 [Candidatus Cloacimonadota bacterium]